MASFVDPSKLEAKTESESRQQPTPLRDFFWDSVVLYAAFGIIGLSAVNVVFQFAQNNKLACNINGSEAATAGASVTYIDNYCYGDLPYIQYISIFNVVFGTLIAAPHYLWLNLAARKFALFFTLATTLNLVPDPKSGMWNAKNNVIVQRVESVYGRHEYSILIGYFVKLIVQMCFSGTGLFVTIFFFAGGSVNFYCPQKFSNSTTPKFWPLNHQVECTYGTLQYLMFARLVDTIFLGVIIFALIFAFANCLFPDQSMGCLYEIAKFRLQSALPSKYGSSILQRPMIRSDLDFLMAQLSRGGGDMAHCFLEIQEFFRRKEMDYNEMARVSFLRGNKGDKCMPNTLTLENLSSELSAVSNWHQLLLSLGVQPREFSKIQEDYQGDDRQRMETISLWLQHTPDASWFAVVRVLEQFGERRVAENIHNKYIALQLCFPLTRDRYLTSYLSHMTGHFPTPVGPTPEELSQAKDYSATPLDPYHLTEHGWLQLEPDVRGAVLSFAASCPRRDVAVFLKYGSSGKFIPYTLARAFREHNEMGHLSVVMDMANGGDGGAGGGGLPFSQQQSHLHCPGETLGLSGHHCSNARFDCHQQYSSQESPTKILTSPL